MNDITTKDYSQSIKLGNRTESEMHKSFTIEERKILWDNIDMDYVDTVIILMYTGYRINEFLDLKTEWIDIDNGLLIGGSKTDAGKNRIVPIHKRIMPLILKRYDKKEKYLLRRDDGKKIVYDYYRKKIFDPMMKELGMQHLPHDTRHTFATMLDNADAKETSIARLIGHTSFETTDRHYIHKDIQELKKAIDLIE